MRHILFVLVLMTLSYAELTCSGQTKATTVAPCSVANTGSNNRFTIRCGIGKAQGDQMILILNKILTNTQQLSSDVVLAKLDEILRQTNPNLPVTTYDCRGDKKIALGTEITDQQDELVGPMEKFYLTRQIPQLMKECLAQMQSQPDWLTPRLYCAVAYANLGKSTEARKMLSDYDARVGPKYSDDKLCRDLSFRLHRDLK